MLQKNEGTMFFKLIILCLCLPTLLISSSEDSWTLVEDKTHMPSFETFELGEKEKILSAVDQSLRYLARKESKLHFPKQGITHDRVVKSLVRFKELLTSGLQGKKLDHQIKKEFVIYRSIGKEKTKRVLFTGYYEPIYDGSRIPTTVYKYPLYRIPPDLALNRKGKVIGRKTADGALVPEYWTRQEIDQGKKLKGRGLEIVYLKDAYEVYMAQFQGSVAIQLTTGERIHLGYAARNCSTVGYSLPMELFRDGKLTKKELLPHLVAEYFQKNPNDLPKYLKKNTSYVFFTERKEAPLGALSVKLFGSHAISTDHRLFPKAALAFVDLKLYKDKKLHPFQHFVLNQDTGGAIMGPGRCEIFFGTGLEAEKKASEMFSEGHLYFLFLKE
ncbi:MAG: hypothetical protein S4CHLAM7_02720 [Chlamydiae bacterium]|nr:hypothetical protein [Chlamydiota bacterium]